jgi:hypothetical protein
MSSPKETNFFLKRSNESLDWYRQRFSEPEKVCGETSPNYSKYPEFDGVPKRMYQLLPDIKLLYLVRDPVERAISHYVHNWAVRREHDSVDEALCPPDESWYVNVSRYHYQISQYLEYYSLKDIFIVESERLREERLEVLSEVFQFIGVEPEVKRNRVKTEHHKSAEKQRTTNAAEFLIRTDLGRALKSIGKAVIPASWVESSKELLRQEVEKTSISPEVQERIRGFLQDEVEQLRRLTGKGFASWSL